MIKLREKFKKSVSVIVLSMLMLTGCSSADNPDTNVTTDTSNTADRTESAASGQITDQVSEKIAPPPPPPKKTRRD